MSNRRDLILATANARYSHTSLALRCLAANLGALRERAAIMEFTLDERAEDEAEPLFVLGRSINETVASLQGMSSQIYETAGQLDSASTEILTATTQQAASANQQSAAILVYNFQLN